MDASPNPREPDSELCCPTPPPSQSLLGEGQWGPQRRGPCGSPLSGHPIRRPKHIQSHTQACRACPRAPAGVRAPIRSQASLTYMEQQEGVSHVGRSPGLPLPEHVAPREEGRPAGPVRVQHLRSPHAVHALRGSGQRLPLAAEQEVLGRYFDFAHFLVSVLTSEPDP